MTPEPSDQAPPVRYEEPFETQVEGETWIVRQRTDEPGMYDVDWVSGPNEGYGFGWSGPSVQRSRAQLNQDIRQFLAEFDPKIGFRPTDARRHLLRGATPDAPDSV